MAKKHKCPDCYKMPLRSRRDIADFILAKTQERSHEAPFCFDVKVRGEDLTFDNLLKKWQSYEGVSPYQSDPTWQEQALEKYEEHKEHLFDWAIDDAREDFDKVRGADTYFTTWDGTQLDIVYSFVGRSGGWLSIDRFEGNNFSREPLSYWEEFVRRPYNGTYDGNDSMPFWTLWRFYKAVTMLAHDTRREVITDEIEHKAAFTFFGNICDEISRKPHEPIDRTQRRRRTIRILET